mmetsp:Transcript_108117/g.304533  ORF Transcript_108117/g.304533 Transcript_108117/m.304533 type:complete len:147 (-) Transcript_108117:137-577(-)
MGGSTCKPCLECDDTRGKAIDLIDTEGVISRSPARGNRSITTGSPVISKREDLQHYSICLEKRADVKLGIDVDVWEESNTLPILSICPGGLVDQWNMDHPEIQVRVGDHIVEVNDMREDVDKMMGRCKDDPVLRIRLRSGDEAIKG